MRNASFSALIFVVCCGIRLQAAELSVNFTAAPVFDDQTQAAIQLSIELSGTTRNDWGKALVAKFQREPAGMTIDEKLDLLKWHLFKLRFVDAERLGEQLIAESGAKDPRVLFSMGVVRVCRGDYEGACRWLRSAEEGGMPLAGHLKAYITCGILDQADSQREYILKLIKSGEMNESSIALAAVLAYSLTATKGGDAFEMFVSQVDRSKLMKSSTSVTDLYVLLCKKHGKRDELKRIEELLERRR